MAVSIGTTSIGIYKDGDFYQVDKSHRNYEDLLAELRRVPRDEDAVMELVEIPKFLAKITAGRVQIDEDAVMFRGQKVGGYMVDRLLAIGREGVDISSWASFMDNLMDNPDGGVRDDLYKWMEAGKLPITDDGYLIAFKKVNANFTDCHTGKFDNSPGSVLEMPRDQCDSSRNNTCSTGFHFCSAGYLSQFGGSKVVVVKVNPKDVTAIPSDYNNQKARCCRYEVISELKDEAAARHKVWAEKTSVNLVDPQELGELFVPDKGKSPSQLDPGAPITEEVSPVKVTKARKPRKASRKAKITPATAAKKASKVGKAPATTMGADGGDQLAFKSKATGVSYSGQNLKDMLDANSGSMAAVGRALSVPHGTISNWFKKLGLK